MVWMTKYRRKVLRGEIAERVREIVREECRKSRVEILRGHIAADHVHIMVSIPPQGGDQPLDPTDEREKFVSALQRISLSAQTVLGSTLLGSRLFLPQ